MFLRTTLGARAHEQDRKDPAALEPLPERGHAGPGALSSPAAALLVKRGQSPLGHYRRRARRGRDLRRYELGSWALQWLFERGSLTAAAGTYTYDLETHARDSASATE
jgi:hypothetical protein